jgi:anti-anti-sigma regulatory factor
MSFRAPGGPIHMTATAISFALGATVTRADVPALCADLTELLSARDGDLVICDVTEVARPDVVTVEALARLRLVARRHDRRLVVAGAGPVLLRLVGLLGLDEALPQPGRQPEQREQPVGVEEVVDRGDPAGGDAQHDQCPRVVP